MLSQGIQPEKDKLFVVFITENGNVEIPNGKKVAAIYKTDDLLIEKGDATNEVLITRNALITKGNYYLGKGYIIDFTTPK